MSCEGVGKARADGECGGEGLSGPGAVVPSG